MSWKHQLSTMSSVWSRYTTNSETHINHAVGLAELVTYIGEAHMGTLVAPGFVLTDLAALYTMWMEQAETIVAICVHSTKLKN